MADPGELTSGDRIDMARKAARSLRLLLEAIQRGELVATQLEMARLRGAMEASGKLPESHHGADQRLAP